MNIMVIQFNNNYYIMNSMKPMGSSVIREINGRETTDPKLDKSIRIYKGRLVKVMFEIIEDETTIDLVYNILNKKGVEIVSDSELI